MNGYIIMEEKNFQNFLIFAVPGMESRPSHVLGYILKILK
jgi:hypothetical protein